jgi:DNA-binding transcriptional MerR regulator
MEYRRTRTNPLDGITLELITGYAEQGFSINQIARILNKRSDAGIRLFLTTHPELQAKLTANGINRKYKKK